METLLVAGVLSLAGRRLALRTAMRLSLPTKDAEKKSDHELCLRATCATPLSPQLRSRLVRRGNV